MGNWFGEMESYFYTHYDSLCKINNLSRVYICGKPRFSWVRFAWSQDTFCCIRSGLFFLGLLRSRIFSRAIVIHKFINNEVKIDF